MRLEFGHRDDYSETVFHTTYVTSHIQRNITVHTFHLSTEQAFEGHKTSSVSIATRLWLDNEGELDLSPVKIKRFFFLRLALGPTGLLYSGNHGLFSQRCEANHSPQSSAEVRNGESYVIKPRDDFTSAGSCMILQEQRSHICCIEPYAAKAKMMQDKQ
jgi:hypothetical protein